MYQGNHASFEERIRRIEVDRKAQAPVPMRTRRPVHRPWRRLESGLKLASLTAIALIGVKVGLMLLVGPQAYAQHRADLQAGGSIERLGAALMEPDVITQSAARLAFGSAQMTQEAMAAATAAATAPARAPGQPIVLNRARPTGNFFLPARVAPADGSTSLPKGAGHFVAVPGAPTH